MIEAKYRYQDENIVEVFVTGHADYDEKGLDIVCAAVSTAVLVTANAIEHLKLNHTRDLIVKDGYFKLNVKVANDTVYRLLDNLKYSLVEIEKQYPKYLKNQKEG